MKLTLIVAASLNNVIGVNNTLPWHLPADLKYFKNLTTGHSIVMGRNTFESIGKPLPNRENIVITRNMHFKHEGLVVVYSIEEALQHCRQKEHDEVFIIGGDTIYKQTLAMADTIYLTRVHTTIEQGDAFFPELSTDIWTKTDSYFHEKDEKNQYDYTFETWKKIQ